jgi:hypothetical protein
MLKWHRELATAAGIVPEHPTTNRELLDGALRISHVLNGPEVVPADGMIARAIA